MLHAATVKQLGSQALVACNVYVSAGRRQHTDLLIQVLCDAQNQAAALRPSHQIAVIHAFADSPYNRSSFHLAGTPKSVATIASSIATNAIQGLLETVKSDQSSDAGEGSFHPFVGLVDHVSIMPLLNNKNNEHGYAAQQVGKHLEDLGVEVFYYGEAHPHKMPLAQVRRLKTSFFRSGGLIQNHQKPTQSTSSSLTPSNSLIMGTATVGAPPTFVENFNIRLTSQCDKAKARTLTKKLRELDGGLLGVEGLTLPYSDSRYEVACNMLRPDVGSATAIHNIVQEWVEENRKETSPAYPCGSEIELVDTMYRVGTTAEMCLEVLSVCQDDSGRAEHDSRVSEKLRAYLNVS